MTIVLRYALARKKRTVLSEIVLWPFHLNKPNHKEQCTEYVSIVTVVCHGTNYETQVFLLKYDYQLL